MSKNRTFELIAKNGKTEILIGGVPLEGVTECEAKSSTAGVVELSLKMIVFTNAVCGESAVAAD